jgi:hypothetical protein
MMGENRIEENEEFFKSQLELNQKTPKVEDFFKVRI